MKLLKKFRIILIHKLILLIDKHARNRLILSKYLNKISCYYSDAYNNSGIVDPDCDEISGY